MRKQIFRTTCMAASISLAIASSQVWADSEPNVSFNTCPQTTANSATETQALATVYSIGLQNHFSHDQQILNYETYYNQKKADAHNAHRPVPPYNPPKAPFLSAYNLSRDQAAAIIGTLIYESNLNAASLTSGGRGIGLWADARYANLLAYATKKHLSPTSQNANFGFLISELSTDPVFGDAFMSKLTATTRIEDAVCVVQNYFAPSSSNPDTRLRLLLAQQVRAWAGTSNDAATNTNATQCKGAVQTSSWTTSDTSWFNTVATVPAIASNWPTVTQNWQRLLTARANDLSAHQTNNRCNGGTFMPDPPPPPPPPPPSNN